MNRDRDQIALSLLNTMLSIPPVLPFNLNQTSTDRDEMVRESLRLADYFVDLAER